MTGGTGFVGTYLKDIFSEKGYQVTILTRSDAGRESENELIRYFTGDPTEPGAWQEEITAYDVIINLAGQSIYSRWNDKVKKKLRSSRLNTTRNTVDALAKAKNKKPFLISASAIGYYGFRGDEILDENAGSGDDFLALMARDWETEANRARNYGAKVMVARFGIVLGTTGGALAQIVPVFKRGAGGPVGSGKQWFSWIHIKDLAFILLFLVENQGISGPVNCTAPNPVINTELAKTLGSVLHKPSLIRTPGFMLKMIMGEFGTVLLNGQRVIPRKLIDSGFSFTFPELREALADLLTP